MFEDSNTLLYVCTIANGYADGDPWTAAGQPSGSGAFVNVDANTVEKTALVAGTNYRFMWKNAAGVLHKSPVFTTATIKNKLSIDDEARDEQITYLGYNGTSGEMDATSDTYYGLQIILNHTFGMLNNSPLILTVPFKSSSAATQSEVAAGIANAATAVLDRQARKPIKVERINSGAQLNAMAAATADVVNGSKTVTLSEDESLTCPAGSIIRLGTSGAGVAPCYIVDAISVDGLTVTLDQKYQGATETIAHTSVETVTEGDWGLKFTGISVPDADFNPLIDEPFVVSFELGVRDFETATVSTAAADKPVLGTGTYQLVRALEAYCLFQNRNRVVSAYPVQPNYTFQAVLGETYVMHSFEIWDDSFADATTGIKPVSKTRIVIAVDDDFDGTDVFYTVLGTTNITGVIT